MRTTTPMTTDANLATEHGWTLINYEAAYEETCDSVFNDKICGQDRDDPDVFEQVCKSVSDAVSNAWVEGMSHDDWTSAARRRMGAV